MNMIVLGALLQLIGVVAKSSIMEALEAALPKRYHSLLPLNEQAIEMGMELIVKAG